MIRTIFDSALAFVLLVITLPVWIIIIILLLVFSPGSPFFAQWRVGQGGRLFRLVKFRTMRQSRPGELCITIMGDTRITPLGRILRRCKLDEIPQFLNILCGSMGFVGPRPEVPEYVELYDDDQRRILDYKPGLVDPATLKYRNEEKILAEFSDPREAYIDKIMPEKINISLEYQKHRNILTDLRVVLRTFGALFQKR